MANRAIEAKKLKMRRQKRLFPRHLSADYIPTGKPPNMIVMRELKERSKSLAFDEEYAKYLDVRQTMDKQGQHISEGRREVSAHIERIKNVCVSLTCVTLANTVVHKVQMFFNEDRSRFILFEANKLRGFVRTSLCYMDRTRCIAAFKSDTVRWVYFSSVRPPSDDTSE